MTTRPRVVIDPTDLDSRYVEHSEVDDTPVDGATTVPVSSNWAYDHAANAAAHHGRYTDAEAVAAVEAESVLQLNKLELDGDPSGDTPSSGHVRLGEATSLVVRTSAGYVKIGPVNTGWCHFLTDRPNFYFDHPIVPKNDVRPYEASVGYCGASDYPWKAVYADTIYEAGSSLASKYLSQSTWKYGELISSTYKNWVLCRFCGDGGSSRLIRAAVWTYENVGGTDGYMVFEIPLPPTYAGYGLNIDQIEIGLQDADASNYITYMYLTGVSAYDTATTLVSDPNNYTTPGTVTYNVGPFDLSSYVRVTIRIGFVVATAGDFAISYVRARVWYD